MASLSKKAIIVVLQCTLLQLSHAYPFKYIKYRPQKKLTFSAIGYLDFKKSVYYLRGYNHWKYWNEYDQGFPDVSIGYLFPTFHFLVRPCKMPSSAVVNRFNEYLSKACYYHYVTRTCARLHPSQLSEFDEDTIDDVVSGDSCGKTYNATVHRQYSIFFSPPFRNALSGNEIRYGETPDGALDERNQKYIQTVFEACEQAARNWCHAMGVPSPQCPAPYRFCGFGQFAEMYVRSKIHRMSHRFIGGIPDETGLYAMFLYFYCQRKWYQDEPLCPNPCGSSRNPCLQKKNTYLHNCVKIDGGVHISDFRCMCLEGFRWDSYSQECVENNLCLESDADGYPCYRPGTARCMFAPQQTNTPTHSCSCLERFMGRFCDTVRDPCVQRFDQKLPAGRNACRSRQGGRCMSRKGSDYYICRCPDGWGHHDQLNFPNCFKRLYGCNRVLCFNGGKCKESPDGTMVLCVCPGEWEGQHCELFRRREWLHWEPWTTCSVNCGKGWNFRRRQCRTGLDSDCGGNAQEIRECEMPCQGLEEKYIPVVKMLQYLQLMLITIAAITFILGLVLRFRLPLIKELVTQKRIEKQKDIARQQRKEEEEKFEQFLMSAVGKLEI